MVHPYKSQALSTTQSKRANLSAKGGIKNLDMSSDPYHGRVNGSTDSMQHKDQSAAPGMKRGGRLDKAKRGKSHKSKTPIVLPDPAQVSPPSPDMGAAQAGAGISPPAPAPGMPPGMPMQKRGGAVKKAGGGAVMPASDRKFPLKAGAETGEGRLQKAKHASKA